MRILMAALAVSFLICASVGHSEAEQAAASKATQLGLLRSGTMEFGGGVLMSFVDGSSLVDIEPVFGYFITPLFEIEGGLGFMRMGMNGSSYSITTVLGKGMLNVDTGTLAVPYGFFGLGFVNYSASYDSYGDDSEGGMLLRFGGGSRLFVTPAWNLRAELQLERIYIEDMDDITTNVMLYLTGLVVP
jgi:hypothetical protein